VAYSHSSGAGGRWWRRGLYPFSSSSISVLFGLSFNFHFSAGMKVSGGGALASSQLAWRRRGYLNPVIL